jgi:cytochrome c oxidase cbb3-type subunit I/II
MITTTTTIEYDDNIVRKFMIASIFWGVVGMAAGVLIAFQLNYWQMNGKILEIITFGWLKNEALSSLPSDVSAHSIRMPPSSPSSAT